MSGWRAPEAWRVLPRDVQRAVLHAARRSQPLPDARLAPAAAAWARWTLRRTSLVIWLATAVCIAGLVGAAAIGPRFLLPVVAQSFLALSAWAERVTAKRLLAAAGRFA